MEVKEQIEAIVEQLNDYQEHKDAIDSGVGDDFNPTTDVSLEDARDHLEEINSLIMDLRQLLSDIEGQHSDFESTIEDYADWWEENPDADKYSRPPKNDLSKYDSDLFGSESE